jgi:two-component system response regulator AtoC
MNRKNENQFKIFVVDDDTWYSNLLEHTVKLNPDHEVYKFHTAKECLDNLHFGPQIVTLDYRLPDMEGLDVLKKIKAHDSSIEVIVISEQDKIDTAVDLLKAGAYDYIVKSKDIRDRLLTTIQHIKVKTNLVQKIESLQKEVEKKYDFSTSIIGHSAAIKNTYELIEKTLNNNITVTVTGETGTGKELVAKAIHYNSSRKNKPFVAINMGAIPSELIESELFGHEKGAFTGANFKRIGKFEEADEGTLFLDEIGEIEMGLQAKLLRAIQEREVTPIGSNKPVKFNCRIIVATHRNLLEEIKKGNFREDLYYRLFGMQIELAPLRERDKDSIVLSNHFIHVYCKENNLAEPKLSSEARAKILTYPWPGNVRELKAVIELAVVMSNGKIINPEDIKLSTGDILPEILEKDLTLKEYDYKIISYYLKKYDNNIKLVAEKLDIGQSSIYRFLKDERFPVMN